MAANAQQMLAKLNGLEDDALTEVISQVLQNRPEIAPSLIDKVCPDLTYAPTKALTHRRCSGTIKEVNKQAQTGSIDCPEIQAIFGVDTKVHLNRIGRFKQGDSVSFALTLDQESDPWAFDLTPASNGSSPSSGNNMGGQTAAMSAMGGGGGKEMDPMMQMMAQMSGMSGGMDKSGGGMGMNPMMAAMMGKGNSGGMDPMMQMMASMNKDASGGMNPMMQMMASMNKDASGGAEANPMMQMMQMMSMMGGGGGGMGGMGGGGMGGGNPMAAMMGAMGGGGGGCNPMAAMMGAMGGGGGCNPMAAMMGAMGGGGMGGCRGPPDCQFYARNGWCKYGAECILKHVGPSKPPPDQQELGEYMGVIKSYNPDKGFGFIACDALNEEHKGDVFLSQKHVGEFQAGAEVKFVAYLVDGKLQGRNLQDATGQVGPQQTAGKPTGAGDEELGDFIGTIKSYNSDKGFGFIVCPVLKSKGHEADVFLPPDTIGGFAVGSTVAFTAYSRDGRLRAKELTDATGMPGASGLPGGMPLAPPGGKGKLVLPPGMPPPGMPPGGKGGMPLAPPDLDGPKLVLPPPPALDAAP